ncbi:hypothetical protein RF11_01729 [Thelohanellus kitauei]|uniref:Uncharacterized protein n=1 Tax=Thelohanellus kitauei TaxID=669202 RepID=A0A0C2IEL2_THEKT|nr:hypothetical protein RF11_01729 [Thelohanellus kitauei]
MFFLSIIGGPKLDRLCKFFGQCVGKSPTHEPLSDDIEEQSDSSEGRFPLTFPVARTSVRQTPFAGRDPLYLSGQQFGQSVERTEYQQTAESIEDQPTADISSSSSPLTSPGVDGNVFKAAGPASLSQKRFDKTQGTETSFDQLNWSGIDKDVVNK